jgi:hypothetical protein
MDVEVVGDVTAVVHHLRLRPIIRRSYDLRIHVTEETLNSDSHVEHIAEPAAEVRIVVQPPGHRVVLELGVPQSVQHSVERVDLEAARSVLDLGLEWVSEEQRDGCRDDKTGEAALQESGYGHSEPPVGSRARCALTVVQPEI